MSAPQKAPSPRELSAQLTEGVLPMYEHLSVAQNLSGRCGGHLP